LAGVFQFMLKFALILVKNRRPFPPRPRFL
jgi:hypothetical protein